MDTVIIIVRYDPRAGQVAWRGRLRNTPFNDPVWICRTKMKAAKTPTSAKDSDKDTAMTGVRAVDRAIAILRCFTAEQPAISVIEIQKRVGLSRPTLYRLL